MFTTLNGSTLAYNPKLSSSDEIMAVSPGGTPATLNLKLVKINEQTTKPVEGRGDIPFQSYVFQGIDPLLTIPAETWGNNVVIIKDLLPINSVSKEFF